VVAFDPWPESWLAEADLADGELPAGRERFEHAGALASELGDPCWEGAAGQGLGRIACQEGRVPVGLRRPARQWVEDLTSLTARTGMRELAVRAHLLRATLGDRGALDSAAILVAEVENPTLRGRIQGLRATIAA
jgi:hypothetical protein